MTRPSRHLDRKLIEVGKKRILASGIANLSIRQICLDEKINLGMFHYYFKTKENFIRILFETLAKDIKNQWLKEVEPLTNAKERVKKILFLNAKMIKEQRKTLETLIKNIDLFDEFYVSLGIEMKKKIGTFYANIIEDCKKEGYLSEDTDNFKYIAFFVGSIRHYAEHCLMENVSDYYTKIEKFIDELVEKFALK